MAKKPGKKVMRAKMVCTRVEDTLDGETKVAEQQIFNAVCSDDAGDFDENGYNENNSFALFTPSGVINLDVRNPDLFGKIAPGDEFYVDFVQVSKKPVVKDGDDKE